MSKLVIKGHATRGREVIELLEMLEGVNKYHINFTEENLLYTIREDDNVIIGTYPNSSISKIFSIEEFLEKFPYKVGDKVYVNSIDYQGIGIVNSMYWDSENKIIRYEVYSDKCDSYWKVEELQPYKEETMEEELMPKIDFNKYCKNKYLLDMGDYEIKIEDGKTYVVRKNSQYPTTYEECCKTLNLTNYPPSLVPNKSMFISPYKDFPHYYEIQKLAELLICRKAYWKIAGEEMGLDKPWEPDWSSCEDKFCITLVKNKQTFDDSQYISRILAFPTEEMRDTFYENFSDLIELCKELL